MSQLKNIFQRIFLDLKQNRLALVILAVYFLLTQLFFGTVCPWMVATHLPCPACGLTRAGMAVLELHFSQAMYWNPAIFLWIPYILYLVIARYFLGTKMRLALPFGVVVTVLTCVIFGYRFFQNTLPVDILSTKLYNFPSIW